MRVPSPPPSGFTMIASRYRRRRRRSRQNMKEENVFAVCFFLSFFPPHVLPPSSHTHSQPPLTLPLSVPASCRALVCSENICFGHISSAFLLPSSSPPPTAFFPSGTCKQRRSGIRQCRFSHYGGETISFDGF